MFFDSGSAEVRPQYMRVLRQFADLLRDHGGGTIIIGGSVDEDEVGTPPQAEPMTASYTLTARFGRLQAALREAGQQGKSELELELDRVAAEWQGVEDIHVDVVGHTSSVRIAPAIP